MRLRKARMLEADVVICMFLPTGESKQLRRIVLQPPSMPGIRIIMRTVGEQELICFLGCL